MTNLYEQCLENVAKAIFIANENIPEYWDLISSIARGIYIEEAKAAIAALARTLPDFDHTDSFIEIGANSINSFNGKMDGESKAYQQIKQWGNDDK